MTTDTQTVKRAPRKTISAGGTPAETDNKTVTATVTATTVLDKFTAIDAWMADRYIEREDPREAAQLAILTSEHVLQLGPPGTAKSEQVEDFVRMFDLDKFKVQMHPMIQEQTLCGPIDLKAYENGSYEHMIDGYLPTAQVAILDEIDKTGPAVFSTMLGILNEREYKHGAQMIDIPLIFAAANCNATLDDPTGATWDRYLLRVQVDYIQSPDGFLKLISGGLRSQTAPAHVTFEELLQAQQEVSEVKIPTAVAEGVARLRNTLWGQGIIVGDRRFRKSMKLVQAAAWLRGSTVAEMSDIAAMRHALWLTPEQRTPVADIVLEIASPDLRRVKEVTQEVTAILGQAVQNNFTDDAERYRWGMAAQVNLQNIYKELGATARSGSPAAALKARDVRKSIPEVMIRVRKESRMAKTAEGARAGVEADLRVIDTELEPV